MPSARLPQVRPSFKAELQQLCARAEEVQRGREEREAVEGVEVEKFLGKVTST